MNSLKGFEMREILIKAYLDYRNNWLTVETWSEHNGLTIEEGNKFLLLAKQVCSHQHPDA